MRLIATLSLALLLALPVTAGAADDAEPTRLPLPDVLDHQDDWYGIYMHGTKSGWARVWTRRVGEGEGSQLLYASDIRIEVKAMGQSVVMTMSERSLFDGAPPYAFRKATYRQADPQNLQTIRVEAGKDGLVATIEEAGTKRTIERDAIDYTYADFWTPQTWFQQGRRVGDVLRTRTFNVSDVETDVDTLTVVGTEETVAGGVPVTLYEVEMASQRDGEEGTALVDARGRIVRMEFAEMFELRLETQEVAQKLEVGGDLFQLGTVAIDRPIGDATKVRRLVVEVDGEVSFPSGPRQSVVRDPDTGVVTLRLGAAHGEPLAATPDAVARNLEETVEYPIHHPDVRALALEAVGEATDRREQVERLVHFVGEYLEDAVLPNATTVMGMLSNPRGDCSEHALLFTALARSLGIPARQVSGLMYMGDRYRRFGGHAWSEVVLDGHWVPVDPAWEQVEVDATHVTVARDDDSTKQQMTFLGSVKLKLIEVETEGVVEVAPSR